MTTAQSSRVILVTGANRGIGYGIVRRLAQQYKSSFVQQQKPLPLTIYVGSRSEDKGKEAIASLQKELGNVSDVQLSLCQLDINDQQSRASAIKLLKEREGGLDTLIDNAGIALEGFDGEVVRKTFETNLFNLIKFNDEILPILRPEARIVILSSMAGRLNGYSDEIVRRFRACSTVDEVIGMANDYQKAVDADTYKQDGWKGAAYSTSKACVTAYTRAMSNQLRKQGSSVAINCVCPGYVNTSMTKGKGVKTLDQGATTPVMLALSDLKGRSGGYYSEEAEQAW